MTELIIATRNKNKIKEIRELLKDLDVKVIGIDDGEWSIPEIIEDGNSFEENAIKKARVVAGITGKLTLSDDSGLEVDVLNGRPGIYSSRFAGETATDRENNIKLLQLLKDFPLERRYAQFHCVVAIAQTPDNVEVVEGICRGIIGFEEKGSSGFGYDPLFIHPDYNKTFAELGLGMKNKVSHRARALEKAKLILERLLLKPDSGETNPAAL